MSMLGAGEGAGMFARHAGYDAENLAC